MDRVAYDEYTPSPEGMLLFMITSGAVGLILTVTMWPPLITVAMFASGTVVLALSISEGVELCRQM